MSEVCLRQLKEWRVNSLASLQQEWWCLHLTVGVTRLGAGQHQHGVQATALSGYEVRCWLLPLLLLLLVPLLLLLLLLLLLVPLVPLVPCFVAAALLMAVSGAAAAFQVR